MERPSWNNIWKRFALDIAQRSPDPKFQVGAVIVTDDNTQVLALGYNGDQKGGPNCRDSLETGKSGFIHAEVNALIKCDFNNPKPKKMLKIHMSVGSISQYLHYQFLQLRSLNSNQ